MDIKTFVSQALLQVVAGVEEAQEKLNGSINPTLGQTAGGEKIKDVEFDIAVTAQEGTQTSVGIAVIAGAFGFGSRGQSEKSDAIVSRLRFAVPIIFAKDKRAQRVIMPQA